MEPVGNCVNCGHYIGDKCIRDYPILISVSPDDTCPDYEPNDYRFNVKNKHRKRNNYDKFRSK